MILSIAGSDNSGGAGIQADIKTSALLHQYCATAVTAVTAQNARGLLMSQYVGDEMLRAQLETILEEMRPEAVKVGMLPCESAIRIVCECIERYSLQNVVVDPVVKATAGGTLADGHDIPKAYIRYLLPCTTLLTPNLDEVALFFESAMTGSKPLINMDTAAAESCNLIFEFMSRTGLKNMLIKGGHGEGDQCVDQLYCSDGKQYAFTGKRVESQHLHGTGCVLSSAIASLLAGGRQMPEVISEAKRMLTEAIKKGAAHPVKKDYGPLYLFAD